MKRSQISKQPSRNNLSVARAAVERPVSVSSDGLEEHERQQSAKANARRVSAGAGGEVDGDVESENKALFLHATVSDTDDSDDNDDNGGNIDGKLDDGFGDDVQKTGRVMRPEDSPVGEDEDDDDEDNGTNVAVASLAMESRRAERERVRQERAKEGLGRSAMNEQKLKDQDEQKEREEREQQQEKERNERRQRALLNLQKRLALRLQAEMREKKEAEAAEVSRKLRQAQVRVRVGPAAYSRCVSNGYLQLVTYVRLFHQHLLPLHCALLSVS
jgi:hypothetical protein